MTDKQKYWITDPEGTFALVEGAEERTRWTRVHGWADATDEPDRMDFVWVRNENSDLGPTRLVREAAELDAWAARGWSPGAPPEPKNPVVAHWPAVVAGPTEPAVAEPAPKTSARATTSSGDK